MMRCCSAVSCLVGGQRSARHGPHSSAIACRRLRLLRLTSVGFCPMRLAHLSVDTIIDEGSVEIATSIKRVTRDEQTIANGQVNAQGKLSLLTVKEDEADVDIFSV